LGYDRGGVKVIAFEVDHGAAIKPAYGYRVEYAGRAVVISGDTRYNRNVIKYGTDADLRLAEQLGTGESNRQPSQGRVSWAKNRHLPAAMMTIPRRHSSRRIVTLPPCLFPS
jgi:ribonuclease BN (tRNA processing enzyme)